LAALQVFAKPIDGIGRREKTLIEVLPAAFD
jgi:hypothetical protein